MKLNPTIGKILEKMEEGTTTVYDAALLRSILDVVSDCLSSIPAVPGEAALQIDIARAMLCDLGEEDAFPEPESSGHDLLPA